MAVSITLSPAARGEIERIRKAQGVPQEQPLRLALAPGGCQPLAYRLGFLEPTPAPGVSDAQPPEPPSQRVDLEGGVTLLIPTGDLPHLQNLHLDYAEDLVGGAFRFQNPNAAEVCGCGASFQPLNPTP